MLRYIFDKKRFLITLPKHTVLFRQYWLYFKFRFNIESSC